MKATSTRTQDSEAAQSCRLRAVWNVDADDSYDVHRDAGQNAGDGLLVRTVAGEGELIFSDGRRLALWPGSLLLIDQGSLARYRCAEKRWHFWWFDCVGPLCEHEVLQLQAWSTQEEAEYVRLLRLLRSASAANRRHASSILAARIAGWLAEPAPNELPVHAAGIDAAIEAMHDALDGSMSLGDLAAIAGLGERHFRNCFREYCGSSPKRFYLDLRLNVARDLLRQHGASVQEAAERLGFSSAFHFSRAFREHFGHPPSKA